MPTMRASCANAVGAQVELVPSRAGTPDGLRAAVLLLVLLAGFFEVDAEQNGTKQGDDDCRADRPEDVGHGVGDRHAVKQVLRFFVRQPKSIDGIGAKAHGGRDCLRTRIKADG